jgi:aminomethyltransferase
MIIDRDHFRTAMQQTPFHPRVAAVTTTEAWANWNCYMAPREVDNLSAEYFAVRSGCSVMDLTPMEKYRISGSDAGAYVDRLVTRDLSKLQPGRVSYVVWCNDEGKLIDDGTLFRLGENDYRLCAQHHQFDWLQISSLGFDVHIEVETHDIAALAVQGPTSCSVLACAGIRGVETLKPFDVMETCLGERRLTISRTGYTGDLGYELWIDPADALALWDALFGVRDRYDVRAIGLSALEMVRIEAGLIMPGFDFNTAESAIRNGFDRSPYEVGLGWAVHPEKGPFTGRRALMAEKRQPLRRYLAKIVVAGNKPLGAAFVHEGKNGRQVGEIKCATWSPVLKANIALADLECREGALPRDPWARVEYERELKWMSEWAQCRIVKGPFYNPEHRNATPPNGF